MDVAVFTLTRDRLEYTKKAFAELKARAGYPYIHYVVDNGSEDGTQRWLQEQPDLQVKLLKRNRGISIASNMVLDHLRHKDYDVVIKMDNDCLVTSDNIVGQVVELFTELREKPFAPLWALSPKVEMIANQPTRGAYTQIAGRRIGKTAVIGGLFQAVDARIYERYRFPVELPYAWGQDDDFCHWLKQNGGEVGYIEGLTVEHMDSTDGQAAKYPEYFERKRREEHEAPPPFQD